MLRTLWIAAVLLGLVGVAWLVDCNEYVMRPVASLDGVAEGGRIAWDVPLDPASPWPKFRADARQSGRSPVRPVPNDRRPWTFATGKGVFSTPVIDGEGTVYVGSADHAFYAIRADGSLAWKRLTGEIIDSAALLDDRGRVYVPSGDAHLYALDRTTGRELWRFRAHTPDEVEALHGIEVYNLDWWEGNVAILPDGSLLAGNDQYLYYRLDRDTGKDLGHLVSNELGWSLPAVNARTGRVFFGSMFVAFRNLFAFDATSGEKLWSNGALGSIVTSPLLTSTHADGAVVVGGFDGYLRAFGQRNGRAIWKRATRDHVYASPAQLSDGRIVAASTDGSVYALDPESGDVVWAFDGLAPIRSSPAVDGADHVYFGAGDGRLVALDPDGTLRWSYRCIEDDRDDLNGSPGLGPHGIAIGGEDGSICFVPWDWCLSDAGRADRRCTSGGGEPLPEAGVRLYFTSRFGALSERPPAEIDANEPLAFTLSVRERGDGVLAAIDEESLRVELSSGRAAVAVSADRRFVTIVPETPWLGPEGGTLRIALGGTIRTDPWRVGLKAFGGSASGHFDERFELAVRPRRPMPLPYAEPQRTGEPGAAFEIGRLAAPHPTMLPSWNQIGFDSIRYLGGVVERSGDRALVWLVGGRHDGATGRAVVDPANDTRFALVLDWDGGLVTLRDAGPFTLDFNGSWGMPYRSYRIATRAAADGRIERRPALNAVADCDRIANYGPFLKAMGMSDWDTGWMHIYGGADLALWHGARAIAAEEVGAVAIEIGEREAIAHVAGSRIRRDAHALGLLLVDAATGLPIPLRYAFDTSVEADASGAVRAVRVRYEPGAVSGRIRAHLLVDTVPVFTTTVQSAVGGAAGTP